MALKKVFFLSSVDILVNVILITIIFSVSHPFVGDYVRLRQNSVWKRVCIDTDDQYVVFADIVNKVTRSSGKVSIIINNLIQDQHNLCIKNARRKFMY